MRSDSSRLCDPAADTAPPNGTDTAVGQEWWQAEKQGGDLPTTLSVLPLTDRPFFPKQVMPIVLREQPWRETLNDVRNTPERLMAVVMARGDAVEEAGTADLTPYGTVVRVGKIARANGQLQFMAEGVQRFRVVEWLSREAPYVAEVEFLQPSQANLQEIKAYETAIVNAIKEMIPLMPLRVDELTLFVSKFRPSDPEGFADFAANLTTASKEELQGVLATVEIVPRLKKVLKLVQKELEVAKLQAQITERIDERLAEDHRKSLLQAQLMEIQKELGVGNGGRAKDEERFRQRLEGIEAPEQLRARVDEELDKLSSLEPISPEYGVTRNYLDWLTVLPWGRYSDDQFNLKKARGALAQDHYGLEEVTERIIEFLAVGAYKGEVSGSILLLVGPPGVGKTSIGRSIAEALGRRFYRFSLGGMRDEAEIKGHRRTYVGAMPGKFIQAMKEVATSNPIIMLDEIDKLGASYRGDPASALLEALDPEQNSDFLDHYLDIRFDLSKVLFICTANQTDTIPTPLLDRMEVIKLPGYIPEQKFEIARRHLWSKVLASAGVEQTQISITDSALRDLVDGYAREAGVRSLNKQLSRIVRKGVVSLMEDGDSPITVDAEKLEHYLGRPLFRTDPLRSGIGVATGLAWTTMGGDTLTIEATRVHSNKRGIQLTGNLGDVMKESASIAYSYVSATLAQLNADVDYFDEASVHLHVSEGSTPKDGPSAGITMATALLSLAKQQPLRRDIAMTGELTLTGQVLPVGGIKEKIIAAHRSTVREVILPTGNRNDFDALPEPLRKDLLAHFVQDYLEVVEVAFAPLKESPSDAKPSAMRQPASVV